MSTWGEYVSQTRNLRIEAQSAPPSAYVAGLQNRRHAPHDVHPLRSKGLSQPPDEFNAKSAQVSRALYLAKNTPYNILTHENTIPGASYEPIPVRTRVGNTNLLTGSKFDVLSGAPVPPSRVASYASDSQPRPLTHYDNSSRFRKAIVGNDNILVAPPTQNDHIRSRADAVRRNKMDPILQRYHDPIVDEQKAVNEKSKVLAKQNYHSQRLPPVISESIGALYDIVHHVPRKEGPLDNLDYKQKRAERRYTRHTDEPRIAMNEEKVAEQHEKRHLQGFNNDNRAFIFGSRVNSTFQAESQKSSMFPSISRSPWNQVESAFSK